MLEQKPTQYQRRIEKKNFFSQRNNDYLIPPPLTGAGATPDWAPLTEFENTILLRQKGNRVTKKRSNRAGLTTQGRSHLPHMTAIRAEDPTLITTCNRRLDFLSAIPKILIEAIRNIQKQTKGESKERGGNERRTNPRKLGGGGGEAGLISLLCGCEEDERLACRENLISTTPQKCTRFGRRPALTGTYYTVQWYKR